MHFDMMRDKAKEMPLIDNAEDIDSLRIWHCKYLTFKPISAYKNVRRLRIATYPDSSLEYLGELENLEHLNIVHLPKISDLSPLAKLRNLKSLYLQTLPSWDSSRKRTVVGSLRSLSEIPNLEHLSLLGVVTADKSLQELVEFKNLKSGQFMGFDAKEIERLISDRQIECSNGPFC